MPNRGMGDKREIDKDKLRELAFIDDLTSLYNRRYLYQYLPVELKDTQSLGGQLCLFMMDIDTFKEINDTYGHLCGDRILVGVAEILRKSFREGDTVVRYAGDEFLAILPGAEENAALNIAKRIIKKIDENPFRESENKPNIHVTMSIGLAIFPRDAQDPEKLIYQADRALYSSKRSGRNRICTTKDISAQILDETRLQELFPCPQLVGREEQMHRLKGLLDEVEKGKTKFASIKGERGMGKSRLINELKKHAQLIKGITNIGASCAPEISAQPYQILITALENLFASLGPQVREFVRSLPEAQTAQLANYIPSLKAFLPKDFKALKVPTGKQAQIDLFKGICQCLIYIVERNVLLLILDDFQWIDKGTLQLLNYLIKDLGNIPLFIAVAYRAEELEKRTDSGSIKDILSQMNQDGLIDEFVLEPLKREDILKMIKAIFTGIRLIPEVTDVVYGVSTGNPLFTEELLRSLVSKELIFYQDGKWQTKEITEASLPPFLKEAIQKRMTALDEETKPVIYAAAVIGEVFDFDVLCQLLEKDPGYVLEVIDRTLKQHLIEPQSPFQTDKFKFSSGAIRDAIYGALGLREKQNLHRKLALIEENAYKGNIDSVAGSLGYHFDKAQDTEKATLYANMLLEKAQRLPAFEDVFGFIQETLLEKIEEIVVPLTDASIKLIPPMVRTLRLATENVRLYPRHSAVRAGFVKQAYKYLTDILDKDSTLIIGTAEGRLLFNGEEISEKTAQAAGAGAFIALMIDHRIESITFKRDLTKEQFSLFLEGLSQSFDDLIPEGGLTGMLRKKDLSHHVRVSEIRYEQTTKLAKQRTKFEEAMLIDYLIGKVGNLEENGVELASKIANDPKKLAKTLKKVAEAAKAKKGEDKTQAQANIIAKGLQKLSEEVLSQTKGGMEQYRKNIAEAIMALDYKLRSKVIRAQAKTEKLTSKDIIEDTIKEFSDEEILEMVKREFSESKGNLVNIRSFIRKFLLDPQRKQKLLPKLKTKLLQLGMGEEEISWVLEENLWQGLSLEEKAQRLLKLPPDSYVKLEASKQVNNLVSQLLDTDLYGPTRDIIDKLLKALEEVSKEVRIVTLNDLNKISETLITKEKYFLLEQIIASLIARLDKEKDPEVYSLGAQLLASICAALIKRQNFMQATGILREFNLRLGREAKLLDIQKQAIQQAKDTAITTHSLVDWLTKLLEKKIESRDDFYELSKVISELGTALIGPLFALGISRDQYADPFKIYALRWSVAKVLKGMDDEVISVLKERLASKNVEQIKVALELLGHMQNKTAVKYLGPLLKHEDLDVRKETIATLGKTAGPEAIKLLSASIKDKDSRIRLTTLWALANIGSPEVLPILKPLLKEKGFSNEVRKVIQRIEKQEN